MSVIKRVLWLLRGLLPLLVVGVGIGLLMLSSGWRKPPARDEAGATARPARVVELARVEIRPRAVGYGVARPRARWRAVAEVSARVVGFGERKELRVGDSVTAGEVLVVLDRRALDLSLKKQQASLGQLATTLAQLAQQEINDKATLKLEQRTLELLEREFQKQKGLAAKGTVAPRIAEAAEQNYQTQRVRVQTVLNSLALYDERRAEVAAERAVIEAAIEQIEFDLSHVVIKAPFDARVASLAIEPTQSVRTGEELLVLDEMAVAEIPAQFGLDQLIPVMRPVMGPQPVVGDLATRMAKAAAGLEVTASIELQLGGQPLRWPGRFSRGDESVDSQTRTVGMIVEVDDPYRRKAGATQGPPLAKGMFCRVELRSKRAFPMLLIPRSALHGEHVYLVGANNTLVRRAVVAGPAHGERVAITSGLEPGERLVITDLFPAVEGMLLAPILDEQAQAALRAADAPSPR